MTHDPLSLHPSLMPDEWFHGSATNEPFQRFDHDRDKPDQYEPKHWNSHLGSHWTSEHATAANLAADHGGHTYHARLDMKNPRHYDSEFDLDDEAFDYHLDNGERFVSDALGPRATDKAHLLGAHPQARALAHKFRDHLESMGYDGITYGNEYEGTKRHTCAIAFDPDQIHISEMHRSGVPCSKAQYHCEDCGHETNSPQCDNCGHFTRTAAGDYRMQHSSPSPDYGAPLHDLTGGGQIYPDDVYTGPMHHYAWEPSDQRSLTKARSLRGKPDAKVRIYRALPPEHAHEGIHPGDWVSIDRSYAKQHGVHPTDPKQDWPVISASVPAKHVYTNGDSISEWGYHGPETVGATGKPLYTGPTKDFTFSGGGEHQGIPGRTRINAWDPQGEYAGHIIGQDGNVEEHHVEPQHAHTDLAERLLKAHQTMPEDQRWGDININRTASADQGLPNPYHSGDGFHHTWFHGSRGPMRGPIHSPDSYSEQDFAGPGRGHGGPQTNKILGTHFSSLYSVGAAFARHPEPSLHHARLDIKNPAYFPDEQHLDRHIFRHALEHHPEFADDEKFNADQRWQGMSTPRTLAERDRQMGDEPDPEKPYARSSLDESMSRAVQMHPAQRDIAKSFVKRLQDEGHDGIVYGNVVEGPRFHHCAIAFHPDQISLDNIEDVGVNRKYKNYMYPDHYKPESEERQADINEQHTGVRERYGTGGSRENLDHGPWTPYNGKHILTPYHAAVMDYEQLPLHPDLPTGMPDRGVIKGNPQLPLYRAMSVEHNDPEFDDHMDHHLGESREGDQKIAERLMGHITAPKSDRGTATHVGLHWTHDKDWAEDFAHHARGMYEKDDFPGSHRPVIVEAHHPGHEHVMSWDNPADHKPLTNTVGPQDVDSWMLGEVPVRPGAPMHIKALHVARSDGSFHRIPLNMHHQAALGDLTDEQREAFADHVAQYHPGLDASNPMIDWLHKADHHLAGDRTMGPRRGQPSLLEDDHPHPASIDPYLSSWQREAGANGPDYDNLTFDDLESFGWPHTEGTRLLRAHHPEHGMVGALYYDDRPNYLRIGRLRTNDEHQRRGVATQMMRELESRYPGKPIQHGMRSDDGHAWAESVYGTPIPENLREKQNWTVNGHEAGLHGTLPDGLFTTYRNIDGKHFILGHVPQPDGAEPKMIGHLSLDGHPDDESHPVSGVQVHPSYRRRGVAGALWSAAKDMGFHPVHTPDEQTEDGAAWADKVAAVRQVSDAASDGDGISQGIMIAVVPPEDLAARLAVEDGEHPAQLHITLAYLGRTPEYSQDQLDHLPEMVAAWAEANEPLKATVQGAGTFVKSEEDGQHVLWASVDAPGLERLHVSLVDFLASRGYSPRGDHVFTPHMTLAYGKHHFRFMPKIERESWSVDEVWICIAGRWESVTLGSGGPDDHRHTAARGDAGRRRRGGDPAPDGEPGDPGAVGDGPGAPRPLSLHPRVEKDIRALHPQDQRTIRDAMDRLAAGDPTLDTHPLTLKLKGWYSTKASRGHRIIHQPDGQGGIYVGYVGLHDYDKAINRLTSSLVEVFAV